MWTLFVVLAISIIGSKADPVLDIYMYKDKFETEQACNDFIPGHTRRMADDLVRLKSEGAINPKMDVKVDKAFCSEE
jgi:hypothetical protein